MESQHTTSPPFLLEIGLSDLHKETNTWLQEIEFWEFELDFYQKLLERITVQTTSVEDKKDIDHFQQLIIYYKGELLDEYRHDLREHEAYLQKLAQEKAPFNDQLYREVHLKHRNQISAFEKGFRQYKVDFFRFAERFL